MLGTIGRQVDKNKEVEAKLSNEMHFWTRGEIAVYKTHALVAQWRQNDSSLDGVEHYFPQFFENSFQHGLLTDLGK